MSEEANLTPQEPGVVESVQVDKIDAIANGTVGDLAESLDALDDDELAALHAAESIGKNRTTALTAIDREQQRRAEGAGPAVQVEGKSDASLGDRESYARMSGKEVDPTTIGSPVLTRDGWVLPAPAAQPKA